MLQCPASAADEGEGTWLVCRQEGTTQPHGWSSLCLSGAGGLGSDGMCAPACTAPLAWPGRGEGTTCRLPSKGKGSQVKWPGQAVWASKAAPARLGQRCLQMPRDRDRKGCDDPRSCQRCSDAHLLMPTLGGRTRSPSPVIADRVCPSRGTSMCSVCCHLNVPLAGTALSCPGLAFCVCWKGGKEGWGAQGERTSASTTWCQ